MLASVVAVLTCEPTPGTRGASESTQSGLASLARNAWKSFCARCNSETARLTAAGSKENPELPDPDVVAVAVAPAFGVGVGVVVADVGGVPPSVSAVLVSSVTL